MPAQRLTTVVPFVPTTCQRCHAPLPTEASPDDPEPTWHQVAELPPQVVHVTEYQGHTRTGCQCGTLNHAAIPADLRVYRFGPHLTVALSYLSGCHHVSHRGIVEVVGTASPVRTAFPPRSQRRFHAGARCAFSLWRVSSRSMERCVVQEKGLNYREPVGRFRARLGHGK